MSENLSKFSGSELVTLLKNSINIKKLFRFNGRKYLLFMGEEPEVFVILSMPGSEIYILDSGRSMIIHEGRLEEYPHANDNAVDERFKERFHNISGISYDEFCALIERGKRNFIKSRKEPVDTVAMRASVSITGNPCHKCKGTGEVRLFSNLFQKSICPACSGMGCR